MKKLNYLLLGMLALGATFTSCSSGDEASTLNGNDASDGETSYIAVRISSQGSGSRSAGSRATYDYGTASENEIKYLNFYFYNASGDYVTKGIKYENVNITREESSDNTEDGNIEAKISEAVVALGPTNGQTATQVLVVANVTPTDADKAFVGKNLTEARTLLASDYKTTIAGNPSTDYFMMTNSTYLDNNALMDAVACTTATTEKAAKDSPATIYIERVAAKVSVTDNTSTVYFDETGSVTTVDANKKYKVAVLGYGLNALEKTSNYIKNVDTSWSYTFGTDSWNNSDNFRSHWAKDPHYTSGDSYPANSEGWAESAPLNYVTFESVLNKKTSPMYCLENTFDDNLFTQYMQAGTSLLVAAQLQAADATDDATAADVYRFMGFLYSLDNYKAAFLNALGHGKFYTDSNHSTEITTDALEIKDKESKDGEVTLKLKDGTYYNSEGTAWTDDDITKALAAVEKADGFKSGYMYYAVPIKHLAATAETTGVPTAVGEYGVVRNHAYNIILTAITGLGHSVWKPDVNIVPNKDAQYYIGADLKILSWRIIPDQEVELK